MLLKQRAWANLLRQQKASCFIREELDFINTEKKIQLNFGSENLAAVLDGAVPFP